MSERQRKIYQSDGDRYQDLVSHEDYEGHILRALDEIINVNGLDVFDLGAGTGRLTLLLAPRVKSIHAFDTSAEMLRVCRDRLREGGFSNWQVDVADHRKLPVEDHSADVIVSGWSVAYLAVWYPDSYHDELQKWTSEMKRVLKPNGKVVLFESLTTGSETPIQLEHLKNYYAWLDEAGFEKKWIRTDFKFDSADDAADALGFFFGAEMEDRIRKNGSAIVPECTGVWWKAV